MNKQELFEKEFERVVSFFNDTNKGKHGYFRLYSSKTPYSKPVPSNTKYSNFETEDIEGALEVIKTQMLLHGRYCPQYWLIKLMSGEKDPNGVVMTVPNVLCEDVGTQTQGLPNIAGFGNNNYSAHSSIIEMQREFLLKQSELEKKLMEQEHERKMERMEERLEALEDGKRTIIDSITGFAEGETGKLLITSLIGMMQGQMLKKNDIQIQSSNEQQSEQKSDAPKESDNIERLKKMFGNDFEGVLNSLVNMCEQNPHYVSTLINQNQQNSNE